MCKIQIPTFIAKVSDCCGGTAGLNHRPRKKLNYKTPWEVFCEMASLNIDDLMGVAFII
jgi:hypothetical protein